MHLFATTFITTSMYHDAVNEATAAQVMVDKHSPLVLQLEKQEHK
jgi:hypothetical protein